jgi:hypothetical protein
MNPQLSDELWVLTCLLDNADLFWDERATIIGTQKQIRALFDLSHGVPFGWHLFKGKQALRFLKHSLKEERAYQRDKALRGKAGSN